MKVHLRKKVHSLPNGICRMFKFDEEAVNELIFEFLCENKNRLFDLTGVGKTEICFRHNSTTGDYICVAYNREEYGKIDFEAIEGKILDIAKTLFSNKKIYIEQSIT